MENVDHSQEVKKPVSEVWRDLMTLSVEVHADFAPVLLRINTEEGLMHKPRGETHHITIISPTENGVLRTMTDDQLEMLSEGSESLSSGGVHVQGIGIIDGAKRDDLRAVDRVKKTCYLALDIPRLQELRASLGLPPKDFHITLGFETGDIHSKVIGKNEKGKDVLGIIEKHADPSLDKYLSEVPGLSFGPPGGQEKQKAQAG